MVNVNEISKGQTVVYEDQLFIVLDFSHVKPGKGAAYVKTKLKNLRTGSIVEKTFNSGTKLEKALIEKKEMQCLFATGDGYNFMNMESFEQIDLANDILGEDSKYLKPELNVFVTFFKGEVLGIEVPDKIDYVIEKTEPAVKGNTTNNAMKDAYLDNGMKVRVPLFVSEGEKITVSTKDGKYDSRA